jgi:hypothetical protein
MAEQRSSHMAKKGRERGEREGERERMGERECLLS